LDTTVVTQQDFERLEKKVDGIAALLSGNGNPASGIIVRLDRMEQIAKDLTESLTCIKEELYGGANYPGLRGRMGRAEERTNIFAGLQAGLSLILSAISTWLGTR
jgi:hypothetical protein